MLYFREGWNYLLELYFWIILGAILLVSLTILLAKPTRKNNTENDYEALDGLVNDTAGITPSSDRNNQIDEESEDETPIEEDVSPEIIEKIQRRKWALGFTMFGSTFMLVGAIILFLMDYEFTTFLGSCMIYVGIIALLKGASFELQKDNSSNRLFSALFLLFLFFINFILLTDLLGVVGTYAWAISMTTRKIGDLGLIYLLPYIIWKVVPTFGASKDVERKNFFSDYLFWNSIIFAVFNYFMLILTTFQYLHWPVLRQYAVHGFQLSLYLILATLLINSLKWIRSKREENK